MKHAKRAASARVFARVFCARLHENPTSKPAHSRARDLLGKEGFSANSRKAHSPKKKTPGVVSHGMGTKPVAHHKRGPGAIQTHPDAAMALAVAPAMRAAK